MAEQPDFVQRRRRLDGPIVLVPHDPAWPVEFQDQRALIRGALGSAALTVEHVGSTSVPRLDAKPILDVSLLVADSADEESYVPRLETAGFHLALREPGWHQHRLLRRERPAVNLHVFSVASAEHDRMVAFRDLLRSDDDALDLYQATKRDLAGRTWEYVQDYADAKTEIVTRLLQRTVG